MNPEDFEDILDLLVERLGPTGQHVYELAVKQALISGATAFLFGLLCISVAGLAAFILWRSYHRYQQLEKKPTSYGVEYEDEHFGVAGICGTIIILTLIVGVPLFAYGLNYLLNPEWQAIIILLGR